MGEIRVGAHLTAPPAVSELNLLAVVVKSQLNTRALDELVVYRPNLDYAKGVNETFKGTYEADQVVLQCDRQLEVSCIVKPLVELRQRIELGSQNLAWCS